MVVPGGIIVGVLLLCVPHACPYICILNRVPEWAQITLFVIGAYIVGLINHSVTEIVWRSFRNNPDEIQAVYDAFEDRHVFVDRSYYVIIFGYYLCICLCLDLAGWYANLILVTLVIIGYFFYTYSHNISVGTSAIVKRYYEEYYFVEEHRPNNAVKIIEAQVAFLKTICLPLCTVSLYITNTSCCTIVKGWTIVLNILSLMIIIAIAVQRQNTIYRIIIEDYKYLSKIKANNNDTNN